MLNIGLEQQQQIRGADGTILWSGGNVVANSFIAQVAVGSVGIGLGEGVVSDETNTVIVRSETTAAGASPSADLPMSLAIFGLRTPAAANTPNFLGVAQEAVGTPGTALTQARRLLIAGGGSLVGVQTTTATLAVGAFVGSSATAGRVAVITVGSALNTVLGAVFKINTVAAPGTGSTGWAGIMVKGGSVAVS